MGETILDVIARILAYHAILKADEQPDGFGGLRLRVRIENSRELGQAIVKAIEDDMRQREPIHDWPRYSPFTNPGGN